MLVKLGILIRYIKYLKKAKTKHGIHSPFVYDFITKVMCDKTHYVSYKKVEEHRKRLLHNKNVVEIVDFGAGAGGTGYKTSFERVKDIARKKSISPKQGQLLHRIVKYFKPEIILEMGTSLGVSSIYQVSAFHDFLFIGMEGCATTASIANQSIKKFLDEKNYSLVIGDFSVMLPGVLEKLNKVDYAFIDGNHSYEPTIGYFMKLLPYARENSIFIIHDIYWSKGMEAAWNEIKDNPKVTITIDLFYMGIIFFRPGIPKQNFILRF